MQVLISATPYNTESGNIICLLCAFIRNSLSKLLWHERIRSQQKSVHTRDMLYPVGILSEFATTSPKGASSVCIVSDG